MRDPGALGHLIVGARDIPSHQPVESESTDLRGDGLYVNAHRPLRQSLRTTSLGPGSGHAKPLAAPTMSFAFRSTCTAFTPCRPPGGESHARCGLAVWPRGPLGHAHGSLRAAAVGLLLGGTQ